MTRAKPGRLSWIPGVSAQPGCMAWKTTPGPGRAPHPFVHEHQLGPLGPGVGDRAVVVVGAHLEGGRGRSAGCTSRPTTPGSPGTGAAAPRAGSSSPVSR